MDNTVDPQFCGRLPRSYPLSDEGKRSDQELLSCIWYATVCCEDTGKVTPLYLYSRDVAEFVRTLLRGAAWPAAER
jgi:hypothetical protein